MYEAGKKISFHHLPSEAKNNSLILNKALMNYDPNDGEVNPISYAQDGALTEENIKLALQKGCIELMSHSPLSKSELFHKINIEQGQILITYNDLPSSIKEDDNLMFKYVSCWPSQFKYLNERQRNNPHFLNEVLKKFDKTFHDINPISFALENALTEENIRLALEQGFITLFTDMPLCKNLSFHRINAELGMPVAISYDDLPDSVREDDNIMLNYVSKCPNIFSNLNEKQKNNPLILNRALMNFKPNEGEVNPISYALEGALTEENIRLALEQKFITLFGDMPLFKNQLFHKINIEQGMPITVVYADLPDSIKEDDNLMLKYVSKWPYVFFDLNERQKNNSQFLYVALNNYNSNGPTINPISFALENALTEENINLAIKKGNIEILKGSALANNRYFVLECLKRKIYTEFYANISETLKNDLEIKEILDVVMPSNIQSKPMDKEHGWSPTGYITRYKYYQAIIGILPNGEFMDEEVRGGSNRSFSHYEGVSNVINDFQSKYPNDETLKYLKEELKKLEDNPFYKAVKCSEYGIIILLIEGENAQIYFPKNISERQFTVLSQMLPLNLKDLNFRFLYDEEEYYEYIEPETHESRDLNYNDAINFIKQNKIYMPVEDIEIEDVSDEPKTI